MSILSKDKKFVALVVLLGLTLLSWLSVIYLNKTLGVLIIVLAFLKVRIIVIHFMELPKTFISLRLAFEAWILLAGGVTIAIYFI